MPGGQNDIHPVHPRRTIILQSSGVMWKWCLFLSHGNSPGEVQPVLTAKYLGLYLNCKLKSKRYVKEKYQILQIALVLAKIKNVDFLNIIGTMGTRSTATPIHLEMKRNAGNDA